MKDQNHSHEDREAMNALLMHYHNLKNGRNHPFIEEEDFERIIDYFDDNNNINEALEAAEISISQFPYSSTLLLRKADLLIATKKYIEALEILNQAALYDSTDIGLYILRTDALLALDKQEEAVEVLAEALQLFEGNEKLDLLFELADVYDDFEEFDKVYDCLKLILEEDPNNEEALYKICFWTDFTGRNEESINLYKKIIDDFPYNEIAWFNLAAAYQGLKLYEKAIDAYQFAIVIDEKFDYAYRNMGDAYLRLKKYREAIEVLEKVLELTRPEDVIYEAIGHSYHRMGNTGQARFHYKKAVHLNPDDSKLYYKIATTYMAENQWQQAIKQLEQALQIHKNVPEYNLAMGECKMKLNLFKDAVVYFSIVVNNKPKKIAGWEALIRCLFKATFYDEAIEQCKAALKITENKPIFIFYYSTALLKVGKTKEGLLQLEKAMEKAPKLLKKFIELNPAILQNNDVVDIVAKYKKYNK
ncbi:MAG TPA: tetratricopeptide repeat protein [Chitinophagaceae bacterium]|nr:tetratricopeptide repeat protein [Chitinophagaceae bacterium]HMZ46151.1 tetratricopeptide repeat protein [Chitinophagaceae bacterium]HNM33997.1 tetratricopeptide repeat protein [Chitinophagaceae bacterium]HNN31129.1 tetratricopeptide repeat protein [Chitinophagaceae bacterium]